jgi:hypothetical protein
MEEVGFSLNPVDYLFNMRVGTVYEFGTPEYEAILPPEKRQICSRSIIMIDVFKVGTVCLLNLIYLSPSN